MKKIYLFLAVFAFTFAVYLWFCPKEYEPIHYFVPLADSILKGKIDVPDNPGVLSELVPVNGKFYVVYPPAPAILALPFVAIFGSSINQVWIEVFYAALSVALFFILTTKFFKERWIQLSLTALLAFGTNFFYTSLNGTSHFFSHISVVLFLTVSLIFAANKKPFLAGLLFSGAFLSRLPVILLLPAVTYILSKDVKKQEWHKYVMWFGSPIVLMIIAFALYNLARFGSLTETGYSLIPGVLEESDYANGIFSLSYIPRNLKIMFTQMPSLFSSYPFFLPNLIGMAIWLTTPALLLLPFSRTKNLTVYLFAASCILAAVPSLMHGTSGFSQFGMRFSLDYIVLLILMLGYAFRRVKLPIVISLLIVSIIINLWAVIAHYQLGLF